MSTVDKQTEDNGHAHERISRGESELYITRSARFNMFVAFEDLAY